MRKGFIILSLFSMVICGISNSASLQAAAQATPYSQQSPTNQFAPSQPPYQPNQSNQKNQTNQTDQTDGCGDTCATCNYPSGCCNCYYPTPGCYPSAPVCGTDCGVSYLSMAIAIGLVVGVAAIILSTGESAHSN